MKVKTVYECSFCGCQGTKSELKKHEVSCEKRVKADQVRVAKELKEKKIRNDIRLTATSWSNLEQQVNDFAKSKGFKLTVIFSDLKYDPRLSNSHNSPVTGTSNWCGQDDKKPKHYPGYHGKVTVHYEAEKKSSDDFLIGGFNGIKIPGISTGSGGSRGSSEYSYELYLFIQDFPLIEAKVKKAHELEELQKQYVAQEEKKANDLNVLVDAAVSIDIETNKLIQQKKDLEIQIQQLQYNVGVVLAKQAKRKVDVTSCILDERPNLIRTSNPYMADILATWNSIK